MELWPLAWIAPLPWLYLIREESLPGRRPYLALWGAGTVFWLLVIHWIRLPHPALYVGWVAMSAYLGVYLPAFVGLSRVAVHHIGAPLIVVAPVVWTGLEFIRGHLLGGFLMGALAHTQYRWLQLIQISDLGGAYAVTFLLMLAAACLVQLVPWRGRHSAAALATLVMALSGTLLYGSYRLGALDVSQRPPDATVALIQGDIHADWKADEGKVRRIFDQYVRLSQQATRISSPDLIVWPETMYPYPLMDLEQDFALPEDSLYTAEQVHEVQRAAVRELGVLARGLDAALLLGIEARQYTSEGLERFNSALLVDHTGQITERYDKMHLVMFGEYIPFARYAPWLQRFSPIGSGLATGGVPRSFEVNGVHFVPNICYESVLPHLVRRQVTELSRSGHTPDVIVNLTNDAWFWGSSELDMHLVCSVFRAVECRKPVLIAANTGLSASIDGDGEIVKRAERQTTAALVTEVRLDGRRSWYLQNGDLLAGTCGVACIALAVVGSWHVLRQRREAAGRR